MDRVVANKCIDKDNAPEKHERVAGKDEGDQQPAQRFERHLTLGLAAPISCSKHPWQEGHQGDEEGDVGKDRGVAAVLEGENVEPIEQELHRWLKQDLVGFHFKKLVFEDITILSIIIIFVL